MTTHKTLHVIRALNNYEMGEEKAKDLTRSVFETESSFQKTTKKINADQ